MIQWLTKCAAAILLLQRSKITEFVRLFEGRSNGHLNIIFTQKIYLMERTQFLSFIWRVWYPLGKVQTVQE